MNNVFKKKSIEKQQEYSLKMDWLRLCLIKRTKLRKQIKKKRNNYNKL